MNLPQLVRAHPRYLAYGFIHCFASSVGQTFFVSLFVVALTERMHWAPGTFAGVYSGVTLLSAFALPLVGARIDALRVRYVSVATAAVLALAAGTLAFAKTPWLLVPCIFLLRLGGQGVMPLIASTTIGRHFTRGRGKALSAAILGVPAAEVIIPALAVWLLASQGFTAVWLAVAGLLAVGFIPLALSLVSRDDAFQTATASLAGTAPSTADELPLRSWTQAEVFRDPRLWLLLPSLIFTPFLVTGMLFNQSLVADHLDLAPGAAAFAISAYGAARIACILLAGGFTDALGPERLPRIVYLPVLAGLALLVLAPSAPTVIAFFALAGVTGGIESVLWPALWSQRYGPTHLGAIKSGLRVVVVLASAVAPIAFDFGLRQNFTSTLAAVLAYCALAVVLAWWERARS